MPRTSPVGEWDIGRSMLCHGTGTVNSCIRLISQRHREITGATPLAIMPRTSPVGEWDMSRSSLSVPWERHSQREYFLRATLDGVDRGLLNCLRTGYLAADGRVRSPC